MDATHNDHPTGEELLAHGEFLSRLACRLVGDGHEAADLVQDAYVAAIERPPRKARALGGWLGRVVSRRASNVRRGKARRAAREEVSARPEAQESHDAALARMEVQRAVCDAVLGLPEAQRTAVFLRYFEGRTPMEIGALLGLPVKTIRSRLARALEALRSSLDTRTKGGREVWLGALAGIGGVLSKGKGSRTSGGGAARHLGGRTMQLLGWSALAVVAVLSGVHLTGSGERGLPGRVHAETEAMAGLPAESAGAGLEGIRGEGGSRFALAVRGEGGGGPDAEHGALRVKLRFASGEPAAGILVIARAAPGAEGRTVLHRAHCDGEGVALFDSLPPGEMWLGAALGWWSDPCEVVAGETTEVDQRLPEGLTVRGRVVDMSGRGVAGAELWLEGLRFRWPFASRVARTDGEGDFVVANILDDAALLGSCAAGFQPSVLLEVGEMRRGKDGECRTILTLGQPGGGIHGRVLDPDGKPVFGAVVLAGELRRSITTGPGGERAIAPQPAPVETDREGRFVAPGGYGRHVPLHVQAPGYPTWSGGVDVPAEGVEIMVRLARGAVVEGTVVDAHGEHIEGVRVSCGTVFRGGWRRDFFPIPRATTDDKGRYRLELVPIGEQEVQAGTGEERLGRASGTVLCRLGEVSRLDLQLDPHPLLSGRVVRPDGTPVSGWRVRGEPARLLPESWYQRSTETDAQGRFQLSNVGPLPLNIAVYEPDSWLTPRARRSVQPDTKDIEIVLPGTDLGKGTAGGIVRDVDGTVPLDASLTIWTEAIPHRGLSIDFDGETGAFRSGPMDAGRYRLTLQRAHGIAWTSEPFGVEEGNHSNLGVLRLEPPGRLEVVVDGPTLGGLRRIALDLDRDYCGTKRLRWEEGRFVSGDLAPGTWVLSTHERELYVTQPVEVVSGESKVVHVRFRMGFSLRVDLQSETEDWSVVTWTTTDGAGKALVPSTSFARDFEDGLVHAVVHLPAGTFRIEARTDTGLTGTGSAEVPGRRGPGDPLTIHLTKPSGGSTEGDG